MSPEPPTVAIATDGTLNVVPNDPPPPYPSRDRRQRRRRPTVELSGADSDDFSFPTSPHHTPHHHLHHPSHHPDETTPLLGVSSPTRRPRATSLSSATSLSPSLAQTVVSAFCIDLDLDAEDAEETSSHGPPAMMGTLPDDHLPHATGVVRRRARGWRARWRHYFRPIGRRAYWSALLHLLVFNFPYALLAWVYLFVFTLVSTGFFTWRLSARLGSRIIVRCARSWVPSSSLLSRLAPYYAFSISLVRGHSPVVR